MDVRFLDFVDDPANTIHSKAVEVVYIPFSVTIACMTSLQLKNFTAVLYKHKSLNPLVLLRLAQEFLLE